MMCAVADTKTSEDSQRDGGVLANLPRTRPQRSSARRAASRGPTTTGANGARAGRATRGKRTSAKARDAIATAPPQAAADVSPDTTDASAKTKSKSGVRATRPAAATKRSSPPRRAAARKSRADHTEEPAPRQGFESYSESAGGSVQPPGGAEFVATAAEIVGELAKAGLSTGERLLKDVLSRLPLS
jgi:hypothetical protein